MPDAVVVIAGETHVAYPIAKDEVVLGRGRECDVVIDAAGVSRRHCALRRRGSGYLVVDLGSRNGIVVNGARVNESAITRYQPVQIGGAVFMVEEVKDQPRPSGELVRAAEGGVPGSTMAVAGDYLDPEAQRALVRRFELATRALDRERGALEELATLEDDVNRRVARVELRHRHYLRRVLSELLRVAMRSLGLTRGDVFQLIGDRLTWLSGAGHTATDLRARLRGRVPDLPIPATVLLRLVGEAASFRPLHLLPGTAWPHYLLFSGRVDPKLFPVVSEACLKSEPGEAYSVWLPLTIREGKQQRLGGVAWFRCPDRAAHADLSVPLGDDRVGLARLLVSRLEPMLETAALVEQLAASERTIAHQHAEIRRAHQELSMAQQTILQQELYLRDQHLAGGFAHEARNAALLAKAAIAVIRGRESRPALTELAVEALDRFYSQLDGILTAAQEPGVRTALGAVVSSFQVEAGAVLGHLDRIKDLSCQADESIQGLYDVVAKIMDYTKIDAQKGDTPIDIDAVVGSVYRTYEPILGEREVEGVTDLHSGAVVVMSETHAKQVVVNLVNNALEAMEGRDTTRLRVSTAREHRESKPCAVIRVADTGKGIAERDVARLFTPFFSTRPDKGTGLGLCITQKIVRMYGGDITYHSREGEGTEFEVSLPVNDADTP